MADKLDLSGDIASAVDSAASRARPLALGYVDEDGNVGFLSRQHACAWAPAVGDLGPEGRRRLCHDRRPSAGVAPCITRCPGYPRAVLFLSFRGRAHVDPSANDEVYSAIIEGERQQDPERKGVAVIIDVDSVNGFGDDGAFRMEG